MKADALSHHHNPAKQSKVLNPEPKLTASLVIASIHWDIMEEIQHGKSTNLEYNEPDGTSFSQGWSTSKTPAPNDFNLAQPIFSRLGKPHNVPAYRKRSREVWEGASVQLQRAIRHQEAQDNCRCQPYPWYKPGHWVWLSTINLC